MTKKHFIALADAIKDLNSKAPAPIVSDSVLYMLAGFCADQNPRFDRSLWLSYIAGDCGPNGGAR